jgi:hypothetical protein
MKKLVTSILTLGCALVLAQNGAYIEYKITTTTGVSGNMKVNVSEFGTTSEYNMIIPQMPGGGVKNKSLVQKSNPEVIYMIDDKNKTATETKKSENVTQDNKNYIVERVGEETMNGYKCVHAKITEGNETHEVWNTRDIADFNKYADAFNSNKKVGSSKREAALKATGCDGFPVKTVHVGGPKEGTMTMELVKLEKKTFAQNEFDIPKGYTVKGSGGKEASQNNAPADALIKSPDEIQKMTPEERQKYAEELRKKYSKSGGQ